MTGVNFSFFPENAIHNDERTIMTHRNGETN